ncbi:MAG TPA: hypothetical protein VHQ47_10650 [Phycisphaerae bacterium]|nr:hypothetical protein [Phycisphaerae bacterium]HVV74237.1 hypothetical protein [Verrucomicrobiae bacterium]
MTLQYRIRNKYQDQLWQYQISLCEALLAKSLDEWCAGDRDFPSRDVVAGILYLLSPRCDANSWSTSDVSQRLKSTAGSPEAEYAMTWPNRSGDEATTLVRSLSEIIAAAVEIWKTRGLTALSTAALMNAVVAEILAQRYVIMHHYETTRRDANHWGI